jgi:hypothetical protein
MHIGAMLEVLSMSDEPYIPAPCPASMADGGRALWSGVADAFELTPEQLVQLEEACRAKDRLDSLDAAIRGKHDVLLSIETDGNGVTSLVVNSALREANATATVLKQLLAALRLPDVEGRRPQYRGPRGAYQKSVESVASAGKVSSLDRARKRRAG